jgi:hypothetical protein
VRPGKTLNIWRSFLPTFPIKDRIVHDLIALAARTIVCLPAVCIGTYNRSQYLGGYNESVIEQICPAAEIMVTINS